ncbi:MAG: MoxR family ATPase [Oscillospiraceae bacterium]|nr:MoxR family ATPase [Oscillospiraceae bacterium]
MEIQDKKVAEIAREIVGQVRRVIVGKDQQLLWVMASMLSGGHILLEDIPGVGKTTMAVAFSKVMGLSCKRVQFTPDVLPSDVTGYSVLDQSSGKMVYQPGAVLCNLFLADELNRATSRTQSALLEAMEEGQVTVDGVVHKLPSPFIVLATQNPTGAAGTQLLPDSQMDRFSIRMSLGYPNKEDEAKMVISRQGKKPMEELETLLDADALAKLQETVANTYVGELVINYVVSLIDATRKDPQILRGASPRATLAVTSMAKAVAQLRGRDYVTPKDIQEVFLRTIAHRLLLSPKAEAAGVTAYQALGEILERVPAPKTV